MPSRARFGFGAVGFLDDLGDLRVDDRRRRSTSGTTSTTGGVSGAASGPLSRLPTPHPCGTDARGVPPLANTRKRALAIALETQEAVLLARAHQVGDRSVPALVEIRLRGAKELLELARIHRPSRLRRRFGEHAAHQRDAVAERRIAADGTRVRLLEQLGQRLGVRLARSAVAAPAA